MIVPFDHSYIGQVIELWNNEAVNDGYKELTEQSFADIFLNNRYFNQDLAFVLLESEQVIGFACGCIGDDLPLGDVAGYITCILVSSDRKTDNHYKQLLHALEQQFQLAGKKQADFLFFNPMHLPWYIPGTPKHEHNNAPGVPVDSALYAFLLEQGYIDRARQCAMYLNLADFSIPEEIRMKEEKAAAKGFTIGLFDAKQHHGVQEMLEGLGNPLWLKEITESTAGGVPVVIAACEGKAAGFAGPVIRQVSGRGYFAGIGVHPEYEGHGLGSILFFKLCEAFKNIGTAYMSLFTGRNNPALRIYEKAGFAEAKEFAIMRKEIG